MNSYNIQKYTSKPPEFGELNLSFSLQPVSLQSSSKKRKYIKDEIRKFTSKIEYLLSGDVKVEIQWILHEQERYESGHSPDIDNIIKPILDGISGPNGILIDDCQVQTIGSHWLDWTKKEHQINIEIRYRPDEFIAKSNLVFVNLGRNLFMPFHTDLDRDANKLILESVLQMMKLRQMVMKETGDYYQAKRFYSSQRVFHKNRIFDEFPTMDHEEFIALMSTSN